MSNVAVELKNVSKRHRVFHSRRAQLLHALWPAFSAAHTDIWALQDVSLTINKGEAIGIIGPNGSGKSTLLQLVTGTTQPTSGAVNVAGRITALLELGSGFNLEYTGRENVRLNGLLHGLTHRQVDERFDDIAAFADIGDFLDRPVKTYSSGMQLRLAFAVQVGLEPDVLIIDEALAVGDIFFRQKCYKRMARLRDEGCTLLLVSHDMSEIQEYCHTALVLNRGHAQFLGPSNAAVQYYTFRSQPAVISGANKETGGVDLSTMPEASGMWWPDNDAFLKIDDLPQVSNGAAQCTAIAVCDLSGAPCLQFEQGQTVVFYYEYAVSKDIDVPIASIILQNVKGVIVHGKNTLMLDCDAPSHVLRGQRLRLRQEMVLDVGPGEYVVETGLSTISGDDYADRHGFSHAEMIARTSKLCFLGQAAFFIVKMPKHGSPVQLRHFGVADLDGSGEMAII